MPLFSENMEETLGQCWECHVAGKPFRQTPPSLAGARSWTTVCQGSMAGPSSFLAYKLPRDDGCVQGFEELPPRHQRSPRPSTVSGSLSEPTRGNQIAPSVQTDASDYPLVPRENTLYQSNVYSGGSESGGRHPVEKTILSSWAPSTRRLYDLKWNVFVTWCRELGLNPVNCPVASVLGFLQDRFSKGLSPSTLRVYVAAIAVFHAPLSDGPLGRHQLVIRFLLGTWRMRPAARSRVPA